MDAMEANDGFERAAIRMVTAGWLTAYSVAPDGLHQLEWKREGAQNAMLLKDLGGKFGLRDGAGAAKHFHMACCRMKLPDGVDFPALDGEAREFWLRCVRDLDLENDHDGLNGMIHLVSGWLPDQPSGAE